MGFLVKHVYETFANNLAFALGICDTSQFAEKFLRSIHSYDVETKALIVVEHILELIFAEHAVVHEYTGQILAYSLVQKHGCDGGVYAAAQSEHHLVVTELFAQRLHSGINERRRIPVLLTTADIDYEVFEQIRAGYRVVDFGMELHAPCLLTFDLIGSHLHMVCRSNYLKRLRHGGDGIAMTHPHLCACLYAAEKRIARVDIAQMGASVFT